ncbi:hypothetical protein HZS_7751 [Henneguya salminicola]|nr:hypothetical protein HZS_7751 [Henneguya salminicola]
MILNNPPVHNHAPNPEDLPKRRIISDLNVQMIRQRIHLPLTIPSDAAQFIIPKQYKNSFRNGNFI